MALHALPTFKLSHLFHQNRVSSSLLAHCSFLSGTFAQKVTYCTVRLFIYLFGILLCLFSVVYVTFPGFKLNEHSFSCVLPVPKQLPIQCFPHLTKLTDLNMWGWWWILSKKQLIYLNQHLHRLFSKCPSSLDSKAVIIHSQSIYWTSTTSKSPREVLRGIYKDV